MLEGIGNFKDAKQNIDVPENNSPDPDEFQSSLEKAAVKVDEMFSDDYKDSADRKPVESSENIEDTEPHEASNEEGQDAGTSFKELFERLFLDDFPDNLMKAKEAVENDSNESNIEKSDIAAKKIAEIVGSPEGIKELIEKHPEKAELWKSQLETLETFNDPDASPAEIRSAQAKLSSLKGQILEAAVKDALADLNFDVEARQRVVEGESGRTKPDVIGVNNTERPLEVFGVTIQPGETISVECKCGSSAYITNQLNNHIPNQLSGQEGTKVLLTTSDIKETPDGLAESICNKYNAELIALDVGVFDVEKAIKEVTGE